MDQRYLGGLYNKSYGLDKIESSANELLIRKLLHEKQNCAEYSKIWCTFTQKMLVNYIDLMKNINYIKEEELETSLITETGERKPIKIKFTLLPKFYVIDDDRSITENIDYSSNVMNTFYQFNAKTKNKAPGHSLGRRVVYYLYPTDIQCQDPDFDQTKIGFRFNY